MTRPRATTSPVPLYHRVFVLLRERIVNGTYAPGDLLPSEPVLMNAFGVSRITIKRALNDLAAEGLVTRARGRGTTVAQRVVPVLAQPTAAGIDGLLANLSAIGRGTAVNVIAFDYEAASPQVAAQLEIEIGTLVQHACRVRYADGSPYAQSTSYVAEQWGQAFTQADLARTPMIELIQRAGGHIERVDQTVSCTLADHDVAERLEVAVGSPLLRMRRVFRDAALKPLNYTDILYAPDRFAYRMAWTRNAHDQLEIDVPTYRGTRETIS